MGLNGILLFCAFQVLFAMGCYPAGDTRKCYSPDQEKRIRYFVPDVEVGTVTNSGDLETKYNRIHFGMDRYEVACILGRSYDEYLSPGTGSDGFFWYEESATVYVGFTETCDFKSITRTSRKQKNWGDIDAHLDSDQNPKPK